MATIEARGDLQWRAKVRRRGYPVQTKTFYEYDDAVRWARSVESDMDSGRFVDKSSFSRYTFKDICERYIKEISPYFKGAVQDISKVKVLMNSELGKYSLDKLDAIAVIKYRDERAKHVKAGTVIKEINKIKTIFTAAATEFKIAGLMNPAEGIRRLPPSVKYPKSRDRRLANQDELNWIINASGSEMLDIVVIVGVETAMRRGEMANCLRKDWDVKDRTLFLRDTKNGDSRTIPLSKLADQAIKMLSVVESGKLFGAKPDSMSQAFRRAVDRARARYESECQKSGKKCDPEFLTNLRLHDMRHEGSSRIAESNKFKLEELGAITGHKSYQQLLKYLHPRAKDFVKRLDD